jgi:uncharacterized protein YbjT (DUF2867 family)
MEMILLTGATGFIGPHVLGNLKRLDNVQPLCLGQNEEALKHLEAE